VRGWEAKRSEGRELHILRLAERKHVVLKSTKSLQRAQEGGCEHCLLGIVVVAVRTE
jgi:hypothetical protein